MSRPSPAPAAESRPTHRFSLAPLGALAAGFGLAGLGPLAYAQSTSAPEARMPEVTVQGAAEREGKAAYQAVQTTAGKGKQELRDIPQSVTVVTEKLMDDRNLDTLKAALHTVTGIAFEAG